MLSFVIVIVCLCSCAQLQRLLEGVLDFESDFEPDYRWARRLIALAVTPVRFLRVVWNNCLTNPPRTGDPLVDANLIAFHTTQYNT